MFNRVGICVFSFELLIAKKNSSNKSSEMGRSESKLEILFSLDRTICSLDCKLKCNNLTDHQTDRIPFT